MPAHSTKPENDLAVACAGAMREIATELADAFERMSNANISLSFDRSNVVRSRVLHCATVDVAISTESAVNEMVRQQCAVSDTAAVVARSKIGVAIRAGLAKPDIRSVESFRRAMLAARSIVCADPATGSPSGTHFIALLRRLDIADAVKPKLRMLSAGESSVVVVCDAVARGEADIGIQQIAEILPVEGVNLAGPLPEELQQVTAFSAVVAAKARAPELARRFITFITSATAAPVILINGMEPPLA